MMPGAFPSPFMYSNPYMFPFPSPMAGWNQWLGSAPFSVTPTLPPYGFQTPSPLVMQTPPHSLFYQGGSSSLL
ncbi:hypothetical protein Gotur_010376 [Gossypium turneri]